MIYLPNAISVPLNISTNIRPIYQWLIMGSYKKIGLSHEMGLIDTPPLPSPGRVAQSVGHLTRKSGVLGSIPGLATYFRFSFRFFKKGSCQLLAKVCARSTG